MNPFHPFRNLQSPDSEPLTGIGALSYIRHVFPNGFRVIVRENPESPVACTDIWVRAGTAHEVPALCGISHFFEHMFFKGTEKRGLGQMDREISSLGGYNNASTCLDCTHFYVVLPAGNWREALDALADALLSSSLPEEEIDRERSVILEEIHESNDDPFSFLCQEFNSAVFAETPYALPILGTPESLAAIRREEMFRYWRKRYTPENMVLSVCGNVRADEVFSEAERFFGHLNAGSSEEIPAWKFVPEKEPVSIQLERRVNQIYVTMGFPTPDIGGTPEEHALDVASSILGEGRGSRLFRFLREEKGLVSSVDVSFSSHERAGFFSFDFSCDPKNADRVERIILNELDRLRKGDYTPEEVHRAKTLIAAGHAMSLERCASVAAMLGQHEVLGRIDEAVYYVERIHAVRAEEIAEAVKKYCPPERLSRGRLVPKRNRCKTSLSRKKTK